MIYIIKKRTFVILCTLLCILLVFQIPFCHMIHASVSKELKPGLNYMILVDCEIHTLYLFLDGEVVKKYSVACGKKETPSPIGLWKVVNKANWGEGFGGYWLGLNVPWGRYGLHGTLKPGSIGQNSSHGCIRMRNDNVRELYRLVSFGTEVLIINGSFGVFGKGFRNINPGARGADVFAVQKKLNQLGYKCGRPDGIYGENMKRSIFKFQEDHGLPLSNTITKTMLEKMGFIEFE